MSIAPSMFAERVDQSAFNSPKKASRKLNNLSRFAMKNMIKNRGIFGHKSDPKLASSNLDVHDTERSLIGSNQKKANEQEPWKNKFASIDLSVKP
jgi:hypothetical protein